MAVVSPHILYVGNTAYDVRYVEDWFPDPNNASNLLVRFLQPPDALVSINQAAFEAAKAASIASSGTLVGDVTGPFNANTVVAIQGVDVSSAAPVSGASFVYNPLTTQWEIVQPIQYFADSAAAVAASPFINGTEVVIYPGSPTSEAGTYTVSANGGAAFPADYTKVSDNTDTASEVAVVDAGSYFTGNNVEAVLQEVGGTIYAGTATQVAFWDGSGALVGDAGLTFDGTDLTLTGDATIRLIATPVVTLGSDTISLDMDVETGSIFRRTTAGSVTLNEPTNLLDGSVIIIEFTQGGTVGSPHTITFSGANWTFTGGIEPELSPDPGSVDRAYIRRVGTDFEVTWVATDGDPAFQFANQVALTNSVANVVDTFLVDDFRNADWRITLEDTTNGDYAKATVEGYHNGTPAADATATVDNGGSGLSFAGLGFTLSTDLAGAGTAQVMRLVITPPASGSWTVSFERLCGGPQ